VVLKDNPVIDKIADFLGFQKPANFPEPVYNFANNKITKEGFELGRALFYEPRLSRNNTITCGSCHIQSSAFTQHGHDVSHGIDDRLGTAQFPADYEPCLEQIVHVGRWDLRFGFTTHCTHYHT
jgi:cytochrome c peroxidase